ncbi:MAG: hypothetical protein ABL879_14070 [Devosia sp.]
MGGQLPVTKSTTLIVLCAFERGDDGELHPAFDAREMQSEERAVREAKLMATRYAGVIAWSRPAKPDEGIFGEPTVLFQSGVVPDMD